MAASARDRSSGLRRGAAGTIQELPGLHRSQIHPCVFFCGLHLPGAGASLLGRVIRPADDQHLVLVILWGKKNKQKSRQSHEAAAGDRAASRLLPNCACDLMTYLCLLFAASAGLAPFPSLLLPNTL